MDGWMVCCIVAYQFLVDLWKREEKIGVDFCYIEHVRSTRIESVEEYAIFLFSLFLSFLREEA